MTHGGVRVVTVQNLRSCGGLSERRMEKSHSGVGWLAFTNITIIHKATLILGAAASRR
jgi:hypothetical protein